MAKTQTINAILNKRKRVQISFPKETRTHQSFKDECDINAIVKKANATGRLPDLIKQNPKYGDFSSPLSYHDAMNVVLHANEQFAALPSHVRQRFQNDAQQFLAFTADPSNLPEMVKMGLATSKRDDSNDANAIDPSKQPPKSDTTTKEPA
ncbi:MAG: internal scaffolding protein [Arizlama microvirus]|nr:MAG: internal scaffolding protein [Arizlama microvirus]